MYSEEEVRNATLQYFNNNDLATSVWMSKYAMKNKDGSFLELTPEDMHKRMAKEFERIELKFYRSLTAKEEQSLSNYGKQRKRKLDKNDFFKMFDQFKSIIPQGSIMAVLGNKQSVSSLSNCIVIPSPYDSYGGIIHTDQQLAQLFKRRCGAGVNISTLRPESMNVKNSANTSTGAHSFMERFSNTTKEVAQNGRRGALMLIMDCRHPDILEFIKKKIDKTKVTGANITVVWTDDFLQAVENHQDYILRFPVDKPLKEATFTKKINARNVWNTYVQVARDCSEPGFGLWSRIKDYTTCDKYSGFEIVASNPCGEIFMSKNDSCRLIAVNMFNSVVNPYTNNAKFNFECWYKTIYEAQRLMDNVVELELEYVQKILQKIKSDPEPNYIKQTETQIWEELYNSGKQGRRTGLGFTALADTIASLGLKYDSKEAINIIEKIMQVKLQAEFDSSIDMAIERGTFPVYNLDVDIENGFIQMLANNFPSLYNRMKKYGRRNISISTNAPVGSVSMLTKLINTYGTSSGIEPVFALQFTRRKKIDDDKTKVDFIDKNGDKWQHFTINHSGLQEWININNLSLEDSPYYKSTANDIDWLKRIDIQAIIQKYVTHSISSTINLPENVTVETVDQIYKRAWEKSLKGVTIYRDKSRDGILITDNNLQKIIKNDAPKRPEKLSCKINNTMVKGEQWVVLVGFMSNDPYEVFAFRNGKLKHKEGELIKYGGGKYNLVCGTDLIIEDIASTHMTDEEQALTRSISLALRHGAKIDYVVEQLGKSHGTVVSFSKAIMRTLKKYAKEIQTKERCPECDGKLMYIEGCKSCVCGFSACS